MNKFIITTVAILSATSAIAGGFEASRLDTKFMYEEGNFAEVSHASLNYSVQAKTFRLTNVGTPGGNPPWPVGTGVEANEESVKSSQARTAASFKTNYGRLEVGFSRYKSGSIQLSGSASKYYTNDCAGDATKCGGAVPNTNVNINTLALLGKMRASENFAVLFGIKKTSLEDSRVTTSRGNFTITGESKNAGIFGFAYSKPDIALRLELLMQPSSRISAKTAFTISDYAKSLTTTAVALGLSDCTVAQASSANFNTTMISPAKTTLNFQSGVAKDTLVFGSIHRVDWESAQINADTGCSATRAASSFWNTTTYTFGVARKISETLALTSSFTKETGGEKTTASLFTVNNGYNALNIGARYKVGRATISAGYNYTKLGNIDVFALSTAPTRNYAAYKNNSVSAFGVKVGYNF